MTAWSAARRRSAVVRAGAITVYSALLGLAAGLVWAALAPRPAIREAFFVRPEAAHELVGIDVWFAGTGLVAGAVVGLTVLAVLGSAGRELGAVLGVAAGGVLGSVLADRVGYLVHGTRAVEALGRVAAVRHYSSRQIGQVASLLDFRVHMPAVLLVWPLVAVVIIGVAALFGDRGRQPPD